MKTIIIASLLSALTLVTGCKSSNSPSTTPVVNDTPDRSYMPFGSWRAGANSFTGNGTYTGRIEVPGIMIPGIDLVVECINGGPIEMSFEMFPFWEADDSLYVFGTPISLNDVGETGTIEGITISDGEFRRMFGEMGSTTRAYLWFFEDGDFFESSFDVQLNREAFTYACDWHPLFAEYYSLT